MKNEGKLADLTEAEQQALLAEVRCIPLFAEVDEKTRKCLQQAELIEAEKGDRILEQSGMTVHSFWILLEGGLLAEYVEPEGTRRPLVTHRGCESFGEVPLLTGSPSRVECTIIEPSRLLRLDEDSFWLLMTTCPQVRKGILTNMATRQGGLIGMVMQREKLAALGTMAAGLMHELNNPGSAAKRATVQLREDLARLQELNLRNWKTGLQAEEFHCIAELQNYVLQPHKLAATTSLDQADAEETLSQWLEEAGIEDAWKLAPPLAAMGLTAEKLECARVAVHPAAVSDILHWLEALVSSVQQLETIEESITRVTELVMAVKHYSYADKMCCQAVDIHKSIQSALMIIGHKIRQKEIQVSKDFSSDVSILQSAATGLHQVWLNLLDNAVDAAPQKGHITVRTWADGNNVYVGVLDDGSGISAEQRPHIFEPFFTSKAEGIGTGLGLSIAYKIVAAHFGGDIRFESEPGKTEFVVRLPQRPPEAAKETSQAGASV
ncbi:MAG: ATP-binding protein [Terriglobia bacterium]|nr:ATP-binding protein [Terriglobia bacterium]